MRVRVRVRVEFRFEFRFEGHACLRVTCAWTNVCMAAMHVTTHACILHAYLAMHCGHGHVCMEGHACTEGHACIRACIRACIQEEACCMCMHTAGGSAACQCTAYIQEEALRLLQHAEQRARVTLVLQVEGSGPEREVSKYVST